MSVSCEEFIGYTLTIKKNLSHEDFDMLNKFLEQHPEYDSYNKDNKFVLVIDGMNGCYARFIYIDKRSNIEFSDDEGTDFLTMPVTEVRPAVYDMMNKAYQQLLCDETVQLDSKLIGYTIWRHYS